MGTFREGVGVQQSTVGSLLPPCGQAVGCPQASVPTLTALVLTAGVKECLSLHPHRWLCRRGAGQASPVGEVS